MQRRSYPTFGLIGNLGNKNLGDEATAASFIRAVKERFPSAGFIGFTVDAEDTVQRHGIATAPADLHASKGAQAPVRGDPIATDSIPAKRSGAASRFKRYLRSVPMVRRAVQRLQKLSGGMKAAVDELVLLPTYARYMRRVDLVVVAGGGQITDHYFGAWNFPYRLLRWAILARLLKKRFVFLNVGAIPLESALSRLFMRWTLRLAHYSSFRDEFSANIARGLGTEEGPVVPDLAFGLPLAPDVEGSRRRGRRQSVGINVFPHRDPSFDPDSDLASYEAYLKKTATYVTSIMNIGYDVVMFPTQLRADTRVIQDLLALLPVEQNGPSLSCPTVATQDDLVNVLRSVDLVVATRFHAMIFSFMLGKPVVALANQQKMIDAMKAMGQEEYLFDVDDVEPSQVVDKVIELAGNSARVLEEYERRIGSFRKTLARQYEDVLWPMIAEGMPKAASEADPDSPGSVVR